MSLFSLRNLIFKANCKISLHYYNNTILIERNRQSRLYSIILVPPYRCTFSLLSFKDWDITITTSCVHAVQRPSPQKCPRSSPTSVTKPSPAISATLDDLWIWVTPRLTTTQPGSFSNWWKILSLPEIFLNINVHTHICLLFFSNWKTHYLHHKY